MVMAAMMDACQSAEILVGMYAPTYDLIRLITAPRMQTALIDHGISFNFNKSDNVIYTSSPGWGDFILRTLDNPARIVGYESYRSHIDEIDTLKFEHAKSAWNKVIARNRQKPKGLNGGSNRVSAYTTPEGFRFAHWRWVVNATPEYKIIQASSRTNPYLDGSYIESLVATYPDHLVEAYIDGKFVNLTTGSVYKSYGRERCRSNETIREGDDLCIGQDFNVGNMASTIFVKRPNGWHVVDELVGIFDTPALIETLQERYNGHRITIYPDASGQSRKTVKASISDISLLRSAGFTVKVRPTNPAVKDRILAVNCALADGRVWVNDRKAPTVANSLEQQAYDLNGEPDKTVGVDHQNDATGYPIAYEMPVRRPVAHVQINFVR